MTTGFVSFFFFINVELKLSDVFFSETFDDDEMVVNSFLVGFSLLIVLNAGLLMDGCIVFFVVTIVDDTDFLG